MIQQLVELMRYPVLGKDKSGCRENLYQISSICPSQLSADLGAGAGVGVGKGGSGRVLTCMACSSRLS